MVFESLTSTDTDTDASSEITRQRHTARPQTRNCIHQPPQGLNSSHPGCYHDDAALEVPDRHGRLTPFTRVFANVEKRPQSTNPPPSLPLDTQFLPICKFCLVWSYVELKKISVFVAGGV
jgi:hypothetical protein